MASPGRTQGTIATPRRSNIAPATSTTFLFIVPSRISAGHPPFAADSVRRGSALSKVSRRLRLAALAGALAAGFAGSPAHAQLLAPGDQLRLTYGPWAYHFSHSAEHVRFNHLAGVELVSNRWTFWQADRSVVGVALFDNSFGQFSQYAWFGQEWDWAKFAGGDAFVTVTAGLLHGYRDQHRDKIPFNSAGIAPVIIPSVGVRWGRFSLQATVLGTNGFLFAGSWVLDLRPGPRMAVPVGPTTGN